MIIDNPKYDPDEEYILTYAELGQTVDEEYKYMESHQLDLDSPWCEIPTLTMMAHAQATEDSIILINYTQNTYKIMDNQK